jgi:hypothetical protein
VSGGEFWISRAVLENSGVCLTSFRTWEDDRSDMIGIAILCCSQNRSTLREEERDSKYRNARRDETRNQRDGRTREQKTV